MTRWLLLLLVLLGCTGDGSSEPLYLGGPIDGPWRIAWTCPDCAIGAYNPLSHTQSLTVDGNVVRYESDECIECGAEHIGVRAGECLEVPAGVDFGVARSAYAICPSTTSFGSIEADITWSGYPGPPEPRTAHMVSAD